MIILSGGERSKYRSILIENDVENIALNVTQFHVPKQEVRLKELMGGANVFVYSSEGDEDDEKYDAFIREHEADITQVIGKPGYDGTWLGEKYVPIWNDGDLERLAYLCQHGRVAISDKALDKDALKRARQLKQRWGTKFTLLSSKVDVIESLDWDYVIVASWTSVERFGETQVWDGRKLWRYSAQKKESARQKHRNDIIRLGIDFEQVVEGDVKELSNLAVRSWLAWSERHLTAYNPSEIPQENDQPQSDAEVTIATDTVDDPAQDGPRPEPASTAIATLAPIKRHENERVLLPVIGVQEIYPDVRDGEDSGQSVTTVSYSGDSVRQCDSCYLAPHCPEFKPNHLCAYKLPIEIKTKAQLRAVAQAMITMQASRIMFAKMGEDMEGQGIDPVLSAEMDRFFRLVQQLKDIEDSSDLVKVSVEARGGGGSVLAQIFGPQVSNKMQEVSTPMSTKELDKVILDAEVLD